MTKIRRVTNETQPTSQDSFLRGRPKLLPSLASKAPSSACVKSSFLRLRPKLLPPLAGEGIADSALAEPSGAGSDAWARYPRTGDFITNVSARRDGGMFSVHVRDSPTLTRGHVTDEVGRLRGGCDTLAVGPLAGAAA